MQHLQSNSTLQGGKYIIERVLGQGGFGITYLAYQPSLQREVAIKEFFMKDYCSRDDDSRTMTAPSLNRGGFVEKYRKKFIKEARNLARLNHPYIISVIDVFEENDTVYYVMPFLSKGSLQDYVEKHGALSEQEAMKYVKQIALALKYMHEEQHICHYDVKPANILVDDKDNAVLIDFGISKNYDAQGQETTTTPVGVSEGYAPIEQYQQNLEEFSPESDVYALGATLYFLLHGKRPVSAIDRANGTALIIGGQLSQDTNNIISASMKIPKKERPNSVSVFLRNDSPKLPSNTIVYLLIGILLFVVLFILGTHYFNNKQESGVPEDSCSIIETFVLKGKVNNSIPFTMHLSLDGNDVEGTEHYDNQKKDAIINIKGTIDNNGTMTLYEYIGNENTGIYTGTLSTDSYSGTFSNNRGKEFSFNSVVMNEDADITVNATPIDYNNTIPSILSQHYGGTAFYRADIPRRLYAIQSWDITWPSSGKNCDVTSLQKYLSNLLFDSNFNSFISRMQSQFYLTDDNQKWFKVSKKGESDTDVENINGDNDNYPIYEPSYSVFLKEVTFNEGIVTYYYEAIADFGTGMGAGIGHKEKYITYNIIDKKQVTFDDVFKPGAEKRIVSLLKTKATNIDDYNCVEVGQIEKIHKDYFYIDYTYDIAYFMFEKYEISCGADGVVKLGIKLSDLRSVLK